MRRASSHYIYCAVRRLSTCFAYCHVDTPVRLAIRIDDVGNPAPALLLAEHGELARIRPRGETGIERGHNHGAAARSGKLRLACGPATPGRDVPGLMCIVQPASNDCSSV